VPTPPGAKHHTVITGTVGSDAHVTGTRILELKLKGAGYNVVGLGCMNPVESFIDAAIETGASAVLISSVYGHGYQDCEGIRGKFIEAGLGNLILYIGGNLVVGALRDWNDIKKSFLGLGFDGVYPPDADLDAMLVDLASALSGAASPKP
jgi:methylaspartate mutase sigma subunit